MTEITEPIVTTTAGKIEGLEQDGLYVFKGIPLLGTKGGLPPRRRRPGTMCGRLRRSEISPLRILLRWNCFLPPRLRRKVKTACI